jgi:hypothetical protein
MFRTIRFLSLIGVGVVSLALAGCGAIPTEPVQDASTGLSTDAPSQDGAPATSGG